MRFVAAALTLALGMIVPGAASAQSEEAAEDVQLPAGYREAFQRGSEEMRLGNFVEARASFQRAHALLPNARTLRGLGKVEFELNNYVASLDYLERALASERRPLTPAMREETGRLLAVTRGLVTHLRLVIEPRTAKAALDGAAIEVDARGRTPVVVGGHELIVQAPGYLAYRRVLDVKSGPETRVHVSLLPLQGGVADDVPLYEEWWFWTAAVGALAVGAVVTAVAVNSRDTHAPNSSVEGAVTWMALSVPGER